MDQVQLQEKISLYYQKLPEETKVLFAGMSWIETLKEIDTKYSLSDEQIQTLGTETTILLLSIINPDDYEQTLRNELKLEEEKINQILKEVNDKIIKNVSPLIYRSYEKNISDLIDETYQKNFDRRFSNLSKDIQDAIAMSNWRDSVYTISSKYNLQIDKQGAIEDVTIQTLCGVIPPEKYEYEIKTKTLLPDDVTRALVIDLNESIFKKIKEMLVENSSQETIEKEEDLPVPPVKETKEEDIPLPPSKIKTITNESIPTPPKKPESETDNTNNIYKDHGIEIIPDGNSIRKEIGQEIGINKIVAPKKEATPINNIIADKLSRQTASQTTVANYTSELKEALTDKPLETKNSLANHDPYRENI